MAKEESKPDIKISDNPEEQNGLKKLKELLSTLAKGQMIETLPDNIECGEEIKAIIKYLSAVQKFALVLANGDLNGQIEYKGMLASSLKALQANLRHLTWQTKVIADGDLNQRVDFMGAFSNSFNTMVDNLRQTRTQLIQKNQELEKLYGELEKDLELAAEVQQATMQFIQDPPFLKSTILFIPYGKVSGDFYDKYSDREGNINVFLGDATGHGTSAALVTMMVKMALNALPGNLSSENIMRNINQLLMTCIPQNNFVTAIHLRITHKGILTFSNAGHPPLIIVPGDGREVMVKKEHGQALGLFSKEYTAFKESSYQLHPGDKIFIFTDGISESYSGSEFYGIERLVLFLEDNRQLVLDSILKNLQKELTDFTKRKGFDDDLTVIAVQFL